MAETSQKLQELLARVRADQAAKVAADKLSQQLTTEKVEEVDLTQLGLPEKLETVEQEEAAVDILKEVLSTNGSEGKGKTIGVARDDIILNDKQQLFCSTVLEGGDIVEIGAAGTGKTTSVRKTTRQLLDTPNRLPTLLEPTKWLQVGTKGCAVLSFTRKAVNNIRHAVVEELKGNTLTIHKLLEFAPIFYEIEDPDKPGIFKKTMRFEPSRNASKPLPSQLQLLIFEESSMIGVSLYNLLQDAMPHAHQEVFLGDIQQLPPVFGMAILGFKMNELPVIELTEVYRQARDNPILDLAWKILEGNPHTFFDTLEVYENEQGKKRKRVPALELLSRNHYSEETGEFVGGVKFQIWQKQISDDDALFTSALQFNAWADDGYYNPQQDIILIPYNKAFGTIELNKRIQQHLGRKRQAIVYEVIAGFQKHYLAVGDRVLYDKEDAIITSIARNGEYLGAEPLQPSEFLDRWGTYQEDPDKAAKAKHAAETAEYQLEAIDNFLAAAGSEQEDRVNQASHIITCRFSYSDEGEEFSLSTAGEINNLLGGNAITIHKFQGSEEDKVFLLLHHSHAKMVSRELLYTAVTRAKKQLHIICEPKSFFNGITSQRIKGDTLAEKIELFKGKIDKKEEMDEELKKLEEQKKKRLRVSSIGGKPAIKLSDLVSIELADLVRSNVHDYWEIAKDTFGDKIGEPPAVDFNISSKNCVGRAKLTSNILQINPIWLAATEFSDDTSLKQGLTIDTVIHEIVHFVEWRLRKNKSHNQSWKNSMIAMGVSPQRLYEDPLPPWVATKNDLISKVFEKYNSQWEEDNETETGLPPSPNILPDVISDPMEDLPERDKQEIKPIKEEPKSVNPRVAAILAAIEAKRGGS